MPRFYFHVHDDVPALDEEGQEFQDFEAALLDAVPNARALAADEVLQGRLNLAHRIEIADHSGRIIASVPFGEVVKVEP